MNNYKREREEGKPSHNDEVFQDAHLNSTLTDRTFEYADDNSFDIKLGGSDKKVRVDMIEGKVTFYFKDEKIETHPFESFQVSEDANSPNEPVKVPGFGNFTERDLERWIRHGKA